MPVVAGSLVFIPIWPTTLLERPKILYWQENYQFFMMQSELSSFFYLGPLITSMWTMKARNENFRLLTSHAGTFIWLNIFEFCLKLGLLVLKTISRNTFKMITHLTMEPGRKLSAILIHFYNFYKWNKWWCMTPALKNTKRCWKNTSLFTTNRVAQKKWYFTSTQPECFETIMSDSLISTSSSHWWRINWSSVQWTDCEKSWFLHTSEVLLAEVKWFGYISYPTE